MIPAIDISSSALVAQRVRMDAISGNLANMSSLARDENGEMQPYEGRYAIFQSDEETATSHGAMGVKVA
jgi:flagellar basal-body rod protein FlgC